MSRVIDTYNGNLVWRVRKTALDRVPTVDQRRRLPLEKLKDEDEEFQYVTYYQSVDRDSAPAHIGTFVVLWEYLSAELQKLHDCRIVHGYLTVNSIVFTDSNTIVFTDFYGMPPVPFTEDNVHRDKTALLVAMRYLFACDEPHRYPLKKLIDTFEQTKFNSAWLHTFVQVNARLSNCTFTAKIDETTYECMFSSSRVHCIVKFTNDAEYRAYNSLSVTRVCPSLMFSGCDDVRLGPYICYAKITPKCQILYANFHTTLLAFQLLYNIHAKDIAHLNICPENIICQPLKNAGNRERLMFVDFSSSRNPVASPDFKLSAATHSMELKREPHRLDFAKSDDVFALAVLLLCLITRVKPNQIESMLDSKKNDRKAYADARDLFKRECDVHSDPMCKVLLEAIVPHGERPRACDVVTKLRLIKQVN